MPGVPIYLRPRPARGVISLLLQRRDRDHDGLCRPRAWHLETLPDGSQTQRAVVYIHNPLADQLLHSTETLPSRVGSDLCDP
jgi:hypothetical protein